MASLQILVIDDELAVRQILVAALTRAGYPVSSAADGEEAAARIAKGDIDVALCDIQMPGMSGIELLRRTRVTQPDTAFIMVTAFASMDTAVEALRAGATDYIVKPVRNEDLHHRLQQIEAMRGLRDENRTLRRFVMGHRDERFSFTSPAMVAVDRLVTRVAPTDSTVLITGESGTGKGIVARMIHELSPRAEAPFIPVNCSAIPENLLESELFGHTKGAFTSADRARKGLFLQAQRGTLFLDEIGELPLTMQTKLLHVIEDKQVRPIGSDQMHTVDARIIAATNRSLKEMIRDGHFREDLFFRLSVFQIEVPPLRERRQDISTLIRFILRREAAGGKGSPLDIAPEAEEALINYTWPGNVRELENVLQRAKILTDDAQISLADLPAEVTPVGRVSTGAGTAIASDFTLKEQIRRMEASIVLRAIEEANGDRRVVAQRLGIGLSSLYRKLEEYERGGIVVAPVRNPLEHTT